MPTPSLPPWSATRCLWPRWRPCAGIPRAPGGWHGSGRGCAGPASPRPRGGGPRGGRSGGAGRPPALALILHDTAALQAAYTALLPRVWELGVAPMLPRLERLWAAALAQAQAEAAGVDPPEFARRVFTRPFGRRFGPGHVFRHYVFAPSYFVSPLRVALFDPELAVLTLDARLGPWAMEQARARLLDGLRAVAEENRLEMLRLLMKDPGHGAWIARRLKLKPATVTHHLALLRRAGLVTETEGPPGAVRYHRTDRAAVQGLIRLLTDYLDDALETDTEPGGHDDAGSH